MPLLYKIQDLLARVSRACGFESADRFPPGQYYPRTRWNRAYFDIPSDLKADAMERRICDAIANTPSVFAHIAHPTPRMQQTLIAIIESTMRRACGQPVNLAAMLINAYASPYTPEARPGLRGAIESTAGQELSTRTQVLLQHLNSTSGAFGLTIEA
ncbi:hypothetical protein [Pseudoduganella sp. GCM10020061]|uniref:hypothetical protein n=1 Tax=Pseudoduganella sp. GCM10020061 TaxID=3317345 RepID=UPI00362865CF